MHLLMSDHHDTPTHANSSQCLRASVMKLRIRHLIPRIRSLASGIALLLLIVSAAAATAAEPFPLSFEAPPKMGDEAARTLTMLAQKHADAMYRHLLLKIDETDRTAALSDEQQARLRLAAKGSVQDALDDWLAPILSELSTGSPQTRRNLIVRLGGPNADQAQVVEVRQVAPNDGFLLGLFRGGKPKSVDLKIDEAAILRHPVFANTFDVVLSDQQQFKVDQAETDRQAIRPAMTRTDKLMREIALQLALDADQRVQVRMLVEKIKYEPVVRWRNGQSGVRTADAAEMALKQLPLAEMSKILTSTQFDIWTGGVDAAGDKADEPVEEEEALLGIPKVGF